jgi:hypothetical protein
VYAFCNAVKTVDARGRKIDNPSTKQPIRCLDARLALPLASTVFTALQNAYTFSSKKLLCSAMVWSLSSPMVLA